VKLTRGDDEASVYLLGACVTSYKTGGTEWLAVRPDAKLDGSKPISGGLPHCFPQFGPGEIQQHGFARNLPWKVISGDASKCVMELTENEETLAMWPHKFRCLFTVELQDGKLATTLNVENTSDGDFNFQAALHSYYDVSSVDTCEIKGAFKGADKLDKTQDPPAATKGDSDSVTISKFVEEIYNEVLPGSVVLSDPAKGNLDIVSGGGWKDVVIWNPYGDKNMGADKFVCVESAALASVPLAPKKKWEATMNLVPKAAVKTVEGVNIDTSGKIPFVKLTRGDDEASVYLLGACVTSYKTGGTEWLAVRPDAKLDGSKPISGGLPHCFPQFGPGEIQQHGFARNLPWKVISGDASKCVMELTENEETLAMWPHKFRCLFTVELQDGKLATTLNVENTSDGDFNFQAALHSYYDVSSVDTCEIKGAFKGADKLDKTQDPPAATKGDSDSVTISKFVEEIYNEVLPGSVVLSDPAKGNLDIVSGGGWKDVVIWNPYGDKNMGADKFVCVESAALASIPLAPKGTWEATMDLVPKAK